MMLNLQCETTSKVLIKPSESFIATFVRGQRSFVWFSEVPTLLGLNSINVGSKNGEAGCPPRAKHMIAFRTFVSQEVEHEAYFHTVLCIVFSVAGHIYVRPVDQSSGWKKMDGTLVEVEVGPQGAVYGANKHGHLYMRKGTVGL